MTSKTEAAVIRSQLALRQDPVTKDWEVYSTFHGSGIFKWIQISTDTVQWYLKNFPEIKINGELNVRT